MNYLSVYSVGATGDSIPEAKLLNILNFLFSDHTDLTLIKAIQVFIQIIGCLH